MTTKFLFGIKPTGNLHIGHLECLKGYKKDEILILIANIHSSVSGELVENYIFLIKQLLSFGFKEKNIIIQSKIEFLFETSFFFSKFSKDSELRRMHLVKEKKENKKTLYTSEYFYPILMCADIFLLNKDKIIIGKDQLQHIELFNDIIKKMPSDISFFSKKLSPCFIECIQGIDGRKMSKSYNNTISFFDKKENIKKKINKISTLNIKKDMEMKNNTLLTICELLIDDPYYKNKIDYIVKNRNGFNEIKIVLLDFVLNKKEKLENEIFLMNEKDILDNIDSNMKFINENNFSKIKNMKKYLNF